MADVGSLAWLLRTLPVSLADIEAAAARLDGVAVRTPLLRLPCDGEVYVKPESLQRTGSFKFRGAFNALASTPFAGDRARRRGRLERKPRAGSRRRCGAARRTGDDRDARERRAGEGRSHCGARRRDRALRQLERGAAARGGRDPRRRARWSTSRRSTTRASSPARERSGSRSRATCPRSRPSSSASAAVASSRGSRRPSRRSARTARVIGVEPELAADAQESLREGHIVTWPAADVTRTICDGVRTQALGELTFATIAALVDEIVTVSEEAVLEAMRWLALEAKLLVEPTAALTLAALRTGAVTGGRADGARRLGRERRSGAGCGRARRRRRPSASLSRPASPRAAPGDSGAAARRGRRARGCGRSRAARRRARSARPAGRRRACSRPSSSPSP